MIAIVLAINKCRIAYAVTGSDIAAKRITGRSINRRKPSSLLKRRCLGYKGIAINPQFFKYFSYATGFNKARNGITTNIYHAIMG